MEYLDHEVYLKNMSSLGEVKRVTWSIFTASLEAQLMKNPPAMQETLIQFLGQEDLQKG